MSDPAICVVGLTGGIASGKSAAQSEFERLGAAVFDADQVSRELVEPGQPALAEVASRFGAGMLDAAGRLDRRQLRQRVFADVSQRRALEAILHPAIRAELQRRVLAVCSGYAVLAIPLLVEAGRYPWIDRVLVIDVPRGTQIQRVMQRDRVDAAQAEAALAAQCSRADRLLVAADVIVNDGPLQALHDAVRRLDGRYRDASVRKASLTRR